jgi:hypothetical protein
MRMRVGRTFFALTIAAPLIAITAPSVPSAIADPPVCDLGNGIEHVVSITFDNVHFFRDNPNVPSDLEQMPTLNDFIQDNGVMLSNNHTPLIAHTAEDSLAIYTGLYGDRHGMPISNSYRTWNPDGTINRGLGPFDGAGSFVYWTDPNNDGGHDTKHAMIYSDSVPASKTTTDVATPAPWVPWTRAGCDVGDVSTANMVLENALFDIPKVFGPNSPETAQLNANSGDGFRNKETADYIGLAVHCSQESPFCADAQAVKFGQVTQSHTAVPDVLPDEPGGYMGYQALFGHKYIAPQLGAGTASLVHNGFPVTNAAGNLVDLSGGQINGAFLFPDPPGTPGFPGFGPIVAKQTLAYMADMLEADVPVVYGYIGDIHERKAGQSGCSTATAVTPPGGTGWALGPGDNCYRQTAQQYDLAFQTFFARLAAAGINKDNTLFVFGAEENDQFDGANVGRAIEPAQGGTPGCLGFSADTYCYASGQIGEINTNLPGLLAAQKGNTTPFAIEPQGAVIYVQGRPGPNDPAVRQLERDVGSLTNPHDPYTGNDDEPIAAYLAGSVEQEILHLVNADANRTPTFTLFPKPDYFFGSTATCTQANQAPCASNTLQNAARFAWDHGYYAPTIDITWAGFVGPGVASLGLDGPEADDGPAVHDPDGGGTVPEFSTVGTWVDLPDIRPTILWLAGLQDSYVNDGRVLSEILTDPNAAIAGSNYTDLAECYKQLNASVGEFATNTLIADTAALKSSGGGDGLFKSTQKKLSKLLAQRDALATELKGALFDAAFEDTALPGSGSQLGRCGSMLDRAEELVTGG